MVASPGTDSGAVQRGSTVFVGRDAELSWLREGLAEAAAGRGSVWFLCGEAGIGKSRLAEELEASEQAADVKIAWGRCWEAGGAPAYWPWIQVLRRLLRDGPVPSSPYLAQLLPELRASQPDLEAPPPLEPEQARFQLLDAVTACLRGLGEERPLLLILEDLHAADASSVLLLDFVARQIDSAPVQIVGTYRSLEAERSELGSLLSRVGRAGHTIPLRRLDEREIEDFLERDTGVKPKASLKAAIHRATEGNPLFLVEMARWLRTSGRLTAMDGTVDLPVTSGVESVIRERLADVSDEARSLLDIASVAGREFRGALLEEVAGLDHGLVYALLEEAVSAAILDETTPDLFRFSHILIREVIHNDLSLARRTELHLRMAEGLLRTAPESEPPWSELAHHYFEAGRQGSERAVDAYQRAAGEAMEQLAFADAAVFSQKALHALETGSQRDPLVRCELLLELARALMLGGDLESGRAASNEAAALARKLKRPDLLARAALERGSIFIYANVDPALVSLLEEALATLDPGEDDLRARVMARYAAALQPCREPEKPIAIARDAIALARRSADDATLLAAIRAGCSAMMDLHDAAERRALNEEQVELATKLGERVEVHRGYVRLVFDTLELADLTGMDAAIEGAAAVAEELGHPHYVWPVAGIRAMRSAMEGRFDDAVAEAAKAKTEGDRAQDPNAAKTLTLQRLGLLKTRESERELLDVLPELEHAFAASSAERSFARLCISGALARIERDDARLVPSPSLVEFALALGDQMSVADLAELSYLKRDLELARAVDARIARLHCRLISGGILGMSCDGPLDRARGLVAELLGRPEEAASRFESALRLAYDCGLRPFVARCARDYGRFLLARGDPRGQSLLREAKAVAASLGMTDLVRRIEALAPSPSPSSPPAAEPGVEMYREGDLWCVVRGDRLVRMKDMKGLRILARLVAEPDQDVHVLELDGQGAHAPAGDAGPLVDKQARAAYAVRIDELRSEIEEAESFNDIQRAEKLRSELDFLTREIARSVGLGGRERRAGDRAERARVNVQRRLKDAIHRIEEQDRVLGRHLAAAVRTGTYCRYAP